MAVTGAADPLARAAYVRRLFLSGAVSLLAQIYLLRHILILFYGNELSLALTLAVWLLGTGLGSLAAGQLLNVLKDHSHRIFAYGQLGSGIALIAAFAASGALLRWSGLFPGEIAGVSFFCVSTVILLVPFCVLNGAVFVSGCAVFPGRGGDPAQAYLVEGLGALCGGMTAQVLLLRGSDPFMVIAAGSVLLIISGGSLLVPRRVRPGAFLLAVAVCAGGVYGGCARDLSRALGAPQWAGRQVIVSADSAYANTTIVRDGETFSLFTNGLYSFSVPDPFVAQWQAHLPLLEHPHPGRVLLIGGGAGGMLAYLLEYPHLMVEYVELDPLPIELCRRYLPTGPELDDPRLRCVSAIDGRSFVSRCGRTYDVVIMTLPAPSTAQINRFYTREFYRQVHRLLDADGVFAFSLSSSPNYLSDEQAGLYRVLRNTLESVFADVFVTPGENNYFFAARQKGTLMRTAGELCARLDQRRIDAPYLREYYLAAELTPARSGAFQQRLDALPVRSLNRDLHPIAYAYDSALWAAQSGFRLRLLFSRGTVLVSAGVLAVLLIALIAAAWRGHTVAVCVWNAGFMTMTFYLVTLLVFQIVYGSVYRDLAILVSGYMCGALIGAFSGKRLAARPYRAGVFAAFQAALAVFGLMLSGALIAWPAVAGFFGARAGMWFLFPLVSGLIGVFGGVQFPLAVQAYGPSGGRAPARAAALVYGIDIIGASAGALLAGVFLIPAFGIPITCIVCTVFSIIGLGMYWTVHH